MQNPTLSRRLVAEFIGTAILLAAVVGSGIMAERLAGGNVAIALLANTIAIGSALVFLILMLGPISGAHMNPAVSTSAALLGDLPKFDAAVYLFVQIAGAIAGVALANLMFDLPALATSTKVRTGIGIWLGEFIATFGLVGVVITVGRRGSVGQTAAAVAAYISAGCWFTSSTSFANPAVTLARTMTDTFTGIRPIDAPAFVIAQIVGMTAATTFFGWLSPEKKIMSEKERVLILCTGNSARSQMAEGILRDIAGDRFEVESAGVSPTSVRPEAIEAMHEIGVDITSHRSKSVDEFVEQTFDYIVTVCDNAKESCPVFPGNATRIHWSFDDPAAVTGTNDERLHAFRRARDQIRERLITFVGR